VFTTNLADFFAAVLHIAYFGKNQGSFPLKSLTKFTEPCMAFLVTNAAYDDTVPVHLPLDSLGKHHSRKVRKFTSPHVPEPRKHGQRTANAIYGQLEHSSTTRFHRHRLAAGMNHDEQFMKRNIVIMKQL